MRRDSRTKHLGPIIATALIVAFTDAAAAGEVITGQHLGDEASVPGMAYSVYLPGGATAANLPVVFLLHGYGGSDTEWLRAGRLAEALDGLIASGQVPPLIAVMPDAKKSWYVDSADRGGAGDYETAIVRDLVREIDARFPTAATPDRRALAGISMGGYGALRLAFKHPDVFGAVVALSPGLFKPDGVSWQHGPQAARRASRHRWYGRTFGAPFDIDLYNGEGPFAYVTRAAEAPLPPDTMLLVGDDDHFGSHDGTVEMYLALRAAGMRPELRVLDGGHDWALWRSMTGEWAGYLSTCWSRPIVRVADRGTVDRDRGRPDDHVTASLGNGAADERTP